MKDPVSIAIERAIERYKRLRAELPSEKILLYTAVLNTCPKKPKGGARARRRWKRAVAAHFAKHGYPGVKP